MEASAASWGVICPRDISIAIAWGFVTACAMPGWVAIRHSERTRSAAVSAISWAIRPPIEMPTMWAVSTSAASSTARQSAAIVSTVYGAPGTSPVRPAPRLSTRMTR